MLSARYLVRSGLRPDFVFLHALRTVGLAALLLLAVVAALGTPPARAAAQDEGEAAVAALMEDLAGHTREAQALLQRTPNTDQTAQLRALRADLASDRDRAVALANDGSLDLRILEAQIEGLGEPPAEGESEPESVTEERARLEAALSKLMRPTLRLQSAQARAAVLVSEIDARLASLTKQRLFSHDVSPLDPRQWIRAGGELMEAFATAQARTREFRREQGEVSIAGMIAGSLVVIVGVPMLGLLGWKWLSALVDRRRARAASIASKLAWTLALDASATVVFAIILAICVTTALLILLPLMPKDIVVGIVPSLIGAGGLIAVGRWLGRGAVLSPFPQLRLISLPEEDGESANRTIQRLTILLALISVLSSLENHGAVGANVSHVLSAILAVIGAWLLWHLSSAFQKARIEADAQSVASHEAIDFATPISRLMRLFGAASVLAALVGYAMLARFLFASTLISLAVIGIAIYFHRSIALVTGLLATGKLHAYRRALHFVPLAAGFLLTLLVLPIIAMIWGFSGAEISDGILLLRNGVDLGEVRLSIGDVATFAAVFFLGFFITRWLQRFLKVTVLPEFAMDAGAEAALLTFLGYLGITLAALIAIATTGLDLSNLAFVAGALSVGLGFGLQSVVENFTSGILLLIERPVKVGDWIEVGDNSGIVRKIAVRSTHIETFDRHQIIVPNSQLIAGVVKNRSFSSGPSRVVVPIGVAYGTDLERVREILLDIAAKDEGVLAYPEPVVIMTGFGDSSLDLRLQAFASDAIEAFLAGSRMNFTIARRFTDENIEIPFPQRDLHLRSMPESMAPQGASLPAG
ncbi:mechanosensitive ion channel family protein [Novosphingobium mangrovi (ex Hu et al. 2023)]|uniref:Mechanosensitive ion channel n=1 Tax=Novosphingobium mangrovi (ex Hu et al. 2023) TaxID=2930094 RepID=A0ABT0AET5_9SPHN|nr:mechanosensitive ion channel domain-containing protein [Novosphingobium mangrovi (ex Hu et al. 2023)]MCJ1961692.1 mechanosensitive ion channel [Novosphingobium mangrovi (ex Hu et al. 2023)]